MTQGIGVEIPMAATTRLHIAIVIGLVAAYSFNPGKVATRVLFVVTGIVALLAPLWLVGWIILSGTKAHEGGSSSFYLWFFLSFAIPGLLATGVGAILRHRFPDLRTTYLAALVALTYVAGFLISMPWSVSGALVR